MSIEQVIKENTIALENFTAEIRGFRSAVMSIPTTPAPTEILPPPLKPARKRRTKAEIAADKQAAAEAKAEANVLDTIVPKEEPPAPPAPPVEETITINQLRAGAQALAALDNNTPSKTLKIAKEIVSDMGVEKLSETPPEKREEMLAKFNQAGIDWGNKPLATVATTDDLPF
jgi:hypothetical protein